MSARLLRMVDRERWSRRDIVNAIDALIDRLDTMDPDPDIEADDEGEPSLGWSSTYSIGRYDGRPLVDEMEGPEAFVA